MPHECPVCGVSESTTGNAFESRDSLVAHMSGKKDEAHRGIGPQKAKSMLDANDVANGSNGTTDNSGTEQGETLEMPSDVPQGDTSGGSGEQCPSCGADAGDVSGLSDGATVKCTECGETLVWRAE